MAIRRWCKRCEQKYLPPEKSPTRKWGKYYCYDCWLKKKRVVAITRISKKVELQCTICKTTDPDEMKGVAICYDCSARAGTNKKAELRYSKLRAELKPIVSDKTKFGCIYHCQNTEAHEDRKWEVYKWAIRKGYKVITEARFSTQKRADLLIITDYNSFVVEVETNQDPKNILRKKNLYRMYDWLDYVAVIDPAKPFNEKDIL